MVLEIALGIILAVFVLGLLEDYPQILYWTLGLVGFLLVLYFWDDLIPVFMVFGIFVLVCGINYLITKYKSKKK